MKNKQLPVASYRRATNQVTMNNVAVYGRKYGSYDVPTDEQETFVSRTHTSGAVNYKPTHRGIIGLNAKPYQRMPKYLKDRIDEVAVDKLVDRFGMNTHYNDTFSKPYNK